MRRGATAIVIALTALVTPSFGQDAPAAPEPSEMPWQSRLGIRAANVDRAFPLINRVVLVPDTATYLDELAKWSPRGRWPVLIDDDVLAPMFIRRFAPKQIVRRDPVGTPMPADLPAAVDTVIAATWGGAAGETPREAFARHGYRPAGVVVALERDPAWTAAVALAAGRGQPVGWLAGDVERGAPGAILPQVSTLVLRSAVDDLVVAQEYDWIELGDEVDAITVCVRMAARGQVQLPADQQPQVEPDRFGPPYAMTDLIGRRGDGARYAITGWIFGDATQSAYVAMCSLFLERERITIWHGYPTGPPWDTFDPTRAEAALTDIGFTVDAVRDEKATPEAWRARLGGGWSSTDLLLMNSKGHTYDFDLLQGHGYPNDVPILNEPLALHKVHSWSMSSPGNRDTIGGRWRERGVYAYVGSSHEPYLTAFVPPLNLVERMVNGAPLLLAARHYPPYPLANPWRVNTFGDPLMLVMPPGRLKIERTAPADHDGKDVRDEAKTLLRACADGGASAPFGEAMHALVLLGRDDLAVQLWQLAEQQGRATEIAAIALEPLFRRRDVPGFLAAWSRIEPGMRSGRARDMLWHLMEPRIPMLDEAQTTMLRSELRRPLVDVDIERLSPALLRHFGHASVRALIERELATAKGTRDKRRLESLLKKY